MVSGGYIKIWRKIRSHRSWTRPRVFSEFEAWLDLIMTAAGKEHEIIYRGDSVKLKRGELIIAERVLAERWKWNRKRVHRMIHKYTEFGEIRVQKRDHRFTIIIIAKYGTYNPLKYNKGTTDRTTGGTTDRTTERPYINKSNKEGNNKINNKETGVDLTKEMLQLFEKEFKRFWDGYDPRGQKNEQYAKTRFMALCKRGELPEFDKGYTGYANYLKHKRINEGFDQAPKYFSTLVTNYKEYIGFEYKPPG